MGSVLDLPPGLGFISNSLVPVNLKLNH